MNRSQLALALAVQRAHADDDPVSSTPGFSLTAPVLTWVSGTGTAVAVFQIAIPASVPSGYKIQGEASLTSGGTAFETVSAAISAGDLSDLQIDTFAFSAFTSGTKYVRVRILDASDAAVSDWSNIVSKTLDVTAPTITSGTTANNAENSVLAHALTANETVTWSLNGGADVARLEISGSTLRWLSNGTKDYETPNDTGTNNVYNVTVRATDTAGNTTDQNIAITVTDVVEGGTWTPADITTLAWWDASDAASLTVASNLVSQMNDKSGNAYHMIGASGQRPANNVTTVNGLVALEFDQSNKIHFQTADTNNGTQEDLVCVILWRNDLASLGGHFVTAGNFQNGQELIGFSLVSTSHLWWRPGAGGSGTAQGAGSTPPFVPGDFVIAATREKSSNDADQRMNGTNIYSANVAVSLDVQYFILGGSYPGIGTGESAGSYFDGAFCEAVWTTDTSDATLEKLEGYLAHKWGKTALLDAGHPYKSVAP